jgi:hypothetical protein
MPSPEDYPWIESRSLRSLELLIRPQMTQMCADSGWIVRTANRLGISIMVYR